MKKAAITILGMIAISGLVMAGSETSSIVSQFICCTTGVCMFAGGLYGISVIMRGEHENHNH